MTTYLHNAFIDSNSCSFSAWLVPRYCHASKRKTWR